MRRTPPFFYSMYRMILTKCATIGINVYCNVCNNTLFDPSFHGSEDIPLSHLDHRKFWFCGYNGSNKWYQPHPTKHERQYFRN